MKDADLLAKVLGIVPPWRVSSVELKTDEARIDIFLEHDKGVRWECPKCGRLSGVRDHTAERTWRHLDMCQFQTFLHARIPRIECPEHGVLQVKVPWAEERSRFTALMERLIIDVLTECSTVSGAKRLLRITWDEAWHVMEKAVARGLCRKKDVVPRYIGIDEKAYKKGHSYITVVCDSINGTVEYIADGRKIESLAEYYQKYSREQLEKIKAITMDMWEPFFTATLQYVPEATGKIVHDKFHVMQHIGDAVDKVRKQENRELLAQKDTRLKGTKYTWLYREDNIPDKHRPTLESLKSSTLKVAKAWAMKESFPHIWDYLRKGNALNFAKGWLKWVTRSKLKPMQEVGALIKRHVANIVTYCKHRITNGVAEGLNSKIMTVKRKACGYRNREHFKTAIYFFCGGLDLYPRLARQ